ncbi:MAG: acetate/propionate family kinase [Hyphomonas sp.]
MSDMLIATLNTGSSSIKIAAYAAEAGGVPKEPLLRVNLSGLPGAPNLSAKSDDPDVAGRFAAGADVSNLALDTLAPRLLDALETALGAPVAAVGHRIVQGGPEIEESRRATPEMLAYLETLTPMAPDHQPHNLAAVRAIAASRPGLAQTLSFDTAFHRSQPRLAQLYAIPRALTEAGMIRYGYHGLSYSHISRRLPELFPDRAYRRTLALHLGSGASLCAMLDGKSVACSMGFSANSGIGMATRSGDLDPGAILYLLSEKQMSAEAVSLMLRQQSGLLGVSGVSGDLRAVEASDTAAAKEAVALFVYRIVRECGSMIAALGGLDALVFTAGIGENSRTVRAGIAEGLAWAGVAMDAAANEAGAADLAAPESAVGIAVIAADEEWEIARGCLAILGSGSESGSE